MYTYPYFMRQPLTILATKMGDVNGDGIPDRVYLIGQQPDNTSPFVTDITLVIQDGRTNASYSIALGSNAGYQPTLFLGDFTGDHVDDILVRIQSGGSGGYSYYYMYSFLNNQARELFDYEAFNDYFVFDVIYRDNYKVDVINRTLNLTFTIDIQNKGEDYLSEIYNSDGTLKEPIEGWVSGLNVLSPVDFDGDGVYELFAFQEISGRYHADGLGLVQTPLSWNGQQFAVWNDLQYVAIYGANV
ncbi:spore coat protein [Halobacillus hunanensis]|uniref:spore coat protein n=1 Tax=Halobacillus hunanensis TaxID=578214 RepID=UPI0009A58EDE|nr:spore coat protein [Halobacillus hunanensis]